MADLQIKKYLDFKEVKYDVQPELFYKHIFISRRRYYRVSFEMKMVMFPEGTRNRTGEKLLPFKRGAFRIAIEAQIPIIPVVFSPYYFIDSERKLFHKGKIIMSTLPPISTKGKTMADLDILLEKTQAIMEEEFQNLRREIHKGYLPLKT